MSLRGHQQKFLLGQDHQTKSRKARVKPKSFEIHLRKYRQHKDSRVEIPGTTVASFGLNGITYRLP
eukprot:3382631-Amphidinium_carterae.1